MIHTSRTVTVGKMESVINEPIMLYRGDREVEIEFDIIGSKFMFSNGGNVIKSTNATNGQLVINTPTGENMFSEVTECNDGKVICVITKEMIDELVEVGFYSFQIRLFDESQVSRVTIPPVYQGIEIRNPIAAEDETDLVDIGLVDFSVVRKDNYENVVTFLPNGDYNKTLWEEHDVISKDRLNKVEDALYEINKGTECLYPTLQNQYDEFSAKVDKDVKAYKEEMEDEVEQFERDMTQAFGEFKVDYKDEVHERLDVVDSQLNYIKRMSYIDLDSYNLYLDGINDDTLELQKAIDDAVLNNTNLVFPPNSKIKLTNTIYLLNQGNFNGHCEIDFNNAEIIVDRDFIIFDSGKMENGIYSSIYDDKFDSHMSFGFVFGNFKVYSSVIREKQVVRIKDWHQGCKLHSIVDISASFVCSKNSYYCEFYNLRNIAPEGSMGIKFLFEGVHNLCILHRLMGANADVIYKFTDNSAAIDFTNNSIEGGKTGILFEGYMWNFCLRNSYMENIEETVIKCTNSVGCKISIKDNFFQFKPEDTTNYLIEMNKNERAKYEVYFDETNRILDMSSDRVFKGGSSISMNNISLPNDTIAPPAPGNADIYKLKKRRKYIR